MINFLTLIFGEWVWKIFSIFIKLILRAKGIKIGTHFFIQGVPKLKLRGKASNIVIGNNVKILGSIDLRNRENGKIFIGNDVTIEQDCRFVSAREGTIQVGAKSIICANAIYNGGGDIIIGEKVIIGPRSSMNANEHVFKKSISIQDAGFIHESIHIDNDCWLAANVVITKGVHLAEGSVIGSGAVVTKNTEAYSINAGIPSKKIGERHD